MLASKKYLVLLSALFAICLIVGGLFYYWLKLPYNYASQKHVAEKFVQLFFNNELEQAYGLILKNHFTAKDFNEFKKRAKTEIREQDNYKILYAYPKQTNGNRLRRLIKGERVDEPRVSIEFDSGVLFRVVVCKLGDNQWKVCRFDSHAG